MLKKFAGFTLVELMVTIAVAAILLTIGAPSLVSLYESTRVDNNIGKINETLAFARNQAINYGNEVTVCAYESESSCKAGKDWSAGIRVFSTADSTKSLRVIDGFHASDTVKASVETITFSTDGLATGGSIIYCASAKASSAKGVIVNIGGLIAYGETGISC
ncbi:GspH/FimT family pseudopilin [Shewanella profunda]|uniref:GspH/FimT family pseudopilin n=1 Tax=Shewanella profunda TaxID=254793 RepID=UPI00200DD987|nr:GspH/FimT family pseudopilin [Shewanella profunda]MCL1092035.1 GspH/FimT family pseudopilin [Shewanella profunda]